MRRNSGNGRRIAAAAGALLVLALIGSKAGAYPEPQVVSGSWQLDYEIEKPQTISVQLPDRDEPTLYWYMPYTVINETGEDRLFVPDVWLMSDAGDLMQGNRKVPPEVFRAIKKREDDPLLMSPVDVVGRLLQGEDHARQSVVIWRVPEHDVDMVRIFFGGLSGETHEVQDPQTGETRLLRKTLMIEYKTPGDAAHRARQPFIHRETRWVIR